MALVVDPWTFSNGTIADAIEVNDRLDVLYTLVNGQIDNANIDLGTGAGQFYAVHLPILDAGGYYPTDNVEAALQDIASGTVTVAGAIPIGGIIPFYDFNGLLTFNTTTYKYCNGASVTVGSIGSQTLPDLSNRYLVGFGTEGGGDNGSAAWSTTPVGNASHKINILHYHTVASHSHTISADGSHNHTGVTAGMAIAATHTSPLPDYDHYDDVNGWNTSSDFIDIGTTVKQGHHDHDIFTEADHDHTGLTGLAAPGTDDQLSATQSIQPRSVRVRWIMRVV
ncbi:MAG: hypothetical protein AB7P94_17370 [Steroidobacteraceae bacterium]